MNTKHEKLVAALKSLYETLESYGDWDDGCFYYAGRSFTELQEPLNKARAVLAEIEKEKV